MLSVCRRPSVGSKRGWKSSVKSVSSVRKINVTKYASSPVGVTSHITPLPAGEGLGEGPLSYGFDTVRKKVLLNLCALWEKNSSATLKLPFSYSGCVLFLTELHRRTEHINFHRDIKSTENTERYSQQKPHPQPLSEWRREWSPRLPLLRCLCHDGNVQLTCPLCK